MKLNDYWKFVFLLGWISSTIIIAILIFTSGLLLHREELPYKSSCYKETQNHTNTPSNIHEQQCSSSKLRVILIIIDALRYDFVELIDIPKKKELPYQNKLKIIHEILQTKPENSKLYKFIADPPTATMQRIKALTTGSMSTFIDISSNFASSEIKEDNIIDILNQENKSAVFMGDDTWSKLYPNRFLRSYPFDSFNVWDLDTVDNGIKHNLFPELKKEDWTLLVAHFLGVDHCGHRYGTIHSEMARKLNEMNDIIKDIINEIQNQEDVLLFVIGDHGMTSSGDHGGDTESEVTSAIFAYSPIHTLFRVTNITNVNQVDIVPTLSSILGLPIPFSNTGSIILGCIPKTLLNSVDSIRSLLWRNIEQITNYIKKYSQHNSQFTSHQLEFIIRRYTNLEKLWQNDDVISLIENYQAYMKNVLRICQEVWVKFTEISILFGLTCLLLISIFAFFTSESKGIVVLFIDKQFFIIFSILFVVSSILGILCAEFFLVDLIVTLYSVTEIFSIILMTRLCIKLRNSISLLNFQFTLVDTCLLIIYVISLILPFSNSFILEEHKIVLFLFVTSLWLITLHNAPKISNFGTFLSSKTILVTISLSVIYRAVISFAKCRGEEDYQCQIAEPAKISNSSCVLAILSFIFYIIFQHKILRISNRIPQIAGILVSVYWICEITVLHIETDFAYVGKIPGILLISSSILLCYLFYDPLMQYYKKKTSRHKTDSFSTLFRISFANAHMLMCIVCVTVLGQLYVIPAILMMVGIWCLALYTDLFPSQKIESDLNTSWSKILLWGLSSIYWFYCTGHNTSFSGIQWNAAFLIQKEIGSSTVIPGLLVVIHTFMSQAIHGIFLMLPLVSPFLNNFFVKGKKFYKAEKLLENAFSMILKYFIFFSIRIFFVMLSAYVNRRHLMMWSVFAPKFIFEALALVFIVIPFSFLGFFLTGRISQRVRN